jgi:hypothetical protein
MRQILVVLAILSVSHTASAQSISNISVTDNGNNIVLAGNFDNDGGGDIVSEDSNGNLNCVPSDSGKYDLGVAVSPVQFPGPIVETGKATATLKTGATDYAILGGNGIVNVYSSAACTFTLTQSRWHRRRFCHGGVRHSG